MQLKLGQIYKCKWCYRSQPDSMGWDMLIYIRHEPPNMKQAYSTYIFINPLDGGNTVALDADLAKRCKELNLEEV